MRPLQPPDIPACLKQVQESRAQEGVVIRKGRHVRRLPAEGAQQTLGLRVPQVLFDKFCRLQSKLPI